MIHFIIKKGFHIYYIQDNNKYFGIQNILVNDQDLLKRMPKKDLQKFI